MLASLRKGVKDKKCHFFLGLWVNLGQVTKTLYPRIPLLCLLGFFVLIFVCFGRNLLCSFGWPGIQV